MIARVVVLPKPAVNDPQGVTVRHGLNFLGFTEVSDVRIGKHIEVRLAATSDEEARARVEEMCRKLLANGVIEDYRFEIEPEEGEAAIPSPVPPHQAGFAGTPDAEGAVGAEQPGWPGMTS